MDESTASPPPNAGGTRQRKSAIHDIRELDPNYEEGDKRWVIPQTGEGSLLATEAHADSFFHYQMQYYAARRPTIQEEQAADENKERQFLEAAERGDKPSMQTLLLEQSTININCTDLLGQTALEIAVDNENVEIVELLLKQPNVRIGNALLYAIREGVYRIVEMMINHQSITSDMLGDGWHEALDANEAASSEYSTDISPVILAAHLNQFEVLQLLLSRGAKILPPHSLSCSCKECTAERLTDSLHHSLRRINTFKALASSAWIALTSSDPILTAFKLSWELQQLSVREHEFKEVYAELSEQCKTFSCDLLSQCRSTEEVIAVLNKEANDDYADVWASKLSLARLKLAIKYEQKRLLTSIWYEGFPGRHERGSFINIFVCLLLILLQPILCVCYILFPKSRIGQIVRSPFMKFLYYSTSFGCFLFLLTAATFEDYRWQKGGTTIEPNVTPPRSMDRGPMTTPVETLILVWVIGMVWSEVKQLWEEGFVKYVFQWWNWLDFIMMSLYLSTFSLRIVAYYLINIANPDGQTYGPRYVPRIYWHSDEPILVSEGLFAVANIFSFARIIYLFQTNPYLGPLQISLGCMLVDVAKFCFIFFLVLSSFVIGMAQLYWYYDPKMELCESDGKECFRNPSAFSSIANSYTTLIWSLFAITNTRDTDVVEDHQFTEMIGRGMLAAYHMISIIVLLNMLIAMMSHSFQIINDHADLEWKFHRTKLWMGHFDEGSSLPAPFNLIVTPKSIFYFCKSCIGKMWTLFGRHRWGKGAEKNRATIRRPGYSRQQKQLKTQNLAPNADKSSEEDQTPRPREPLSYQDIMHRLVARFIHQTKKAMKMDGVNEDDLLEIKQDISSLRYELRDERRVEQQRSSTHIEGVKRDIMRTLSLGQSKGRSRIKNDEPSTAEVTPLRLASQSEQVPTRRSKVSFAQRPTSLVDSDAITVTVTSPPQTPPAREQMQPQCSTDDSLSPSLDDIKCIGACASAAPTAAWDYKSEHKPDGTVNAPPVVRAMPGLRHQDAGAQMRPQRSEDDDVSSSECDQSQTRANIEHKLAEITALKADLLMAIRAEFAVLQRRIDDTLKPESDRTSIRGSMV